MSDGFNDLCNETGSLKPLATSINSHSTLNIILHPQCTRGSGRNHRSAVTTEFDVKALRNYHCHWSEELSPLLDHSNGCQKCVHYKPQPGEELPLIPLASPRISMAILVVKIESHVLRVHTMVHKFCC